MMNKTYSAVFLACMGLGLAGCNDSDDAQTITPPPVVEEATPRVLNWFILQVMKSGYLDIVQLKSPPMMLRVSACSW